MNNIQEAIFEIAKYGLGKSTECRITKPVDAKSLFELAQKQCLHVIVLDGINKCYENGIQIDIDFQTKMKWIGLVQQMEQRYQQYEKNIKELEAFYREHGIRMMALKGYGLAQNYPIPSHRPCGRC